MVVRTIALRGGFPVFYEDILVDIPKKKRITSKGHSKPYVYEVLARKNAENPRDIVKCVGLAADGKRMHPNEVYFELHPEEAEKCPLEEEGVFSDQIRLGNAVLLRAAANKVGLTGILKECFPGHAEVIQTLLEYYMTERDSSAQLFQYYLYDHYTTLNYIPSESTLSRLFNHELTAASIHDFLEKWMRYRLSHVPAGESVDIDFDSTNYNIGSGNLESAEYGHPKIEEGLPQVNVAYFLEHKTGVPVYYDVYYGSIIDMEHCRTAMEKVRAVQEDLELCFVMDRGYFSRDNLSCIGKHYTFLCLGKSGVRLNQLIEEYPSGKISSARNRVYGTTYGIRLHGKAFAEDTEEYWLYLYYNASSHVSEVEAQQDILEYQAQTLIGKRDRNGGIRNTFGKRLNLKFNEDDVITEAEPNYDYLDSLRDTSGYFWIVSNREMTVSEAISSYRHRDIVEKSFRSIKSDADLNKVYAGTDHVFETKSFLGFLTAILRADITTRLRPYYVQYSSRTSQTVLKEMEKIKAEELKNKYYLRYALTSHQKQILSFYDLRLDDVRNYIQSLNERLPLIEKPAAD